MGKYETNYEVPPVSRKNLRVFAKLLRDSFGIKTIKFPVIEFLEALDGFGVYYDIVDDAEWNQCFGVNEHAEYNLVTRTISIKESVYNHAIAGYGRDRFTIAHEIAHALLLDDSELKVAKIRGKQAIPLFRNPEWQADCLAGELLMPYHKCKNMTVTEIAETCQVSLDAAICQKSKF